MNKYNCCLYSCCQCLCTTTTSSDGGVSTTTTSCSYSFCYDFVKSGNPPVAIAPQIPPLIAKQPIGTDINEKEKSVKYIVH